MYSGVRSTLSAFVRCFTSMVLYFGGALAGRLTATAKSPNRSATGTKRRIELPPYSHQLGNGSTSVVKVPTIRACAGETSTAMVRRGFACNQLTGISILILCARRRSGRRIGTLRRACEWPRRERNRGDQRLSLKKTTARGGRRRLRE